MIWFVTRILRWLPKGQGFRKVFINPENYLFPNDASTNLTPQDGIILMSYKTVIDLANLVCTAENKILLIVHCKTLTLFSHICHMAPKPETSLQHLY